MNLKRYKLKFYQFIYFTLNGIFMPFTYLQIWMNPTLETNLLLRFLLLGFVSLIMKRYLLKEESAVIFFTTIIGILCVYLSIFLFIGQLFYSVYVLKSMDWSMWLFKYAATFYLLLSSLSEANKQNDKEMSQERTSYE